MTRHALILVAAVGGLLAFGPAQAGAYGDDPSPPAPAQVVTYPTDVAGLGDTLPIFDAFDVAFAGIADTAVGIDAAPADPVVDPPPGTTLVVDDDHAQCPTATFTSINAAVVAALPGDTIRVCPGVYNESVIVNKTLTFRGSTQFGDGGCLNPVAPDPKKDSIVRYPLSPGTGANGGSAGFSVNANNVVIDGFTVEPGAGVTQDGDGIYSSPMVSGTVAQENILQRNARGIHVFSNGLTQTIVRKNCIRDNNLGPENTLQGQGIYLDIDFSNALIENNVTALNTSAAMNLYIVSNVVIRDNKSVGDSSAVAIFFSSAIDVRHNKAIDSTGSAIFVGGDSHDLHIVGNHVATGDFTGIRFSDLAFGTPSLPSFDLEVRDNQVENIAGSGIRASPNSLVTSILAGNHSHDNGIDGIRIEAGGNAGNVITGNTLKHNTEHDCHDDTTGPGTGGTANVWTNNEGDTQNRPGLCKHAAP
jgi:nitrous oxidase accessory protein NosD